MRLCTQSSNKCRSRNLRRMGERVGKLKCTWNEHSKEEMHPGEIWPSNLQLEVWNRILQPASLIGNLYASERRTQSRVFERGPNKTKFLHLPPNRHIHFCDAVYRCKRQIKLNPVRLRRNTNKSLLSTLLAKHTPTWWWRGTRTTK